MQDCLLEDTRTDVCHARRNGGRRNVHLCVHFGILGGGVDHHIQLSLLAGLHLTVKGHTAFEKLRALFVAVVVDVGVGPVLCENEYIRTISKGENWSRKNGQ